MIFPGSKSPDGTSPEAIYQKRLESIARDMYQHNQVAGAKVNRTTQGDFMLPESSGAVSLRINQYSLRDVRDDYLVCAPLPRVASEDLSAYGDAGRPIPTWIGSLSADPDSALDGDFYYNVGGTYFIFFGGSWHAMTLGTHKVYVAKEPLHRTSLEGERILGADHAYTYSDGDSESWAAGASGRYNRIRHDDDGDTVEDQRIVPPWRDGEIISAIPATTGSTRPKSDSDTTPLRVALLVYGRSCQWAKKRAS